MKKLVVCGDSFGWGTSKDEWPYMVSEAISYKLINLSIIGCSNLAICYQLDHAINNLNPDLIIITLTTAERLEIDFNDNKIPATYDDFKWNASPLDKSSGSIRSGNIAWLSRSLDEKLVKNYVMSHSSRLSAQRSSWCLQHLFDKINCKYLVYRGVFPQFHKDKSNYNNENYFGLEKYIINSGPANYENTKTNTNNHLTPEDNQLFANKVLVDLLIHNKIINEEK